MAYGIEIFDTDGATTVLGPSTRYINVMNEVTPITVPAAANGENGSVLIQQDMTGLTTSNCDLLFVEQYVIGISIHRVTTGPVISQGFRLENSGNTAKVVTPFIIRF